ncbi:MAG: efflux transporter outer membrane subunit, partial [Planctomycetota bacterium]
MPPRRRWVSLVCAFAATWSLIGCANLQRWRDNGFKVGPNYARPLAPADPQYLDVDDPRVVPQPAGDALWWRSFNDPTLEGLIEAAYQQNLSLRAAGLRVLEARRERDIAAGTLFPQEQGLFGAGTRALLSDETATANPLSPRRFSQFETNFNLTWEIDVWGRIRRAIESADAAVDLTVEDYDDLLVTLVSDVAVAYFELRGFDERIRLAKQNVVLQAGSLKIVEARKEAGAVSELDLKEAELNLADTLASIPVLQQGRRQTVNRLAVLLGMTPGQLAPILEETAPLPEPPTEVFVSVPADLLRRRPDVRSAERQVAVQSAQIGIAEAELYPRFVLAGDIGFSAGNIADLTRDGATAGSISPGFSWSILNYGRLVNAIRVEELRFQQTVLAYENAVLTAHQEAEDAVVAFLRTGEQVEYLERSAAAAARSVELALTRYREGEIDFSRVFVLESSLVARQDQLVAAQSQRAIAAANVYRALGGGWEIRLQQPYAGRAPLPLVPQTDWL